LPKNEAEAASLVGDGAVVPVVRFLAERVIKPLLDSVVAGASTGGRIGNDPDGPSRNLSDAPARDDHCCIVCHRYSRQRRGTGDEVRWYCTAHVLRARRCPGRRRRRSGPQFIDRPSVCTIKLRFAVSTATERSVGSVGRRPSRRLDPRDPSARLVLRGAPDVGEADRHEHETLNPRGGQKNLSH
jgi:hypothetical protein